MQGLGNRAEHQIGSTGGEGKDLIWCYTWQTLSKAELRDRQKPTAGLTAQLVAEV